jgi:hypothetical protein
LDNLLILPSCFDDGDAYAAKEHANANASTDKKLDNIIKALLGTIENLTKEHKVELKQRNNAHISTLKQLKEETLKQVKEEAEAKRKERDKAKAQAAKERNNAKALTLKAFNGKIEALGGTMENLNKKHITELKQRDDAHASTIKPFKKETEAKRKERNKAKAEARKGLDDNAEAAKEVEDKTCNLEGTPYKSPFAPDEANVANVDKRGPDHQLIFKKSELKTQQRQGNSKPHLQSISGRLN